MAAPGSFPPALTGLCIARQNNRASPSSAALRPFRSAPGAGPVRPPSIVAMKAAAVAVDPTREHPMSTDHDDTGFEPELASSPTDHVLSELRLYAFRPFPDEPDPRPLPEGNIVAGAIADILAPLIVHIGDPHPQPT